VLFSLKKLFPLDVFIRIVYSVFRELFPSAIKPRSTLIGVPLMKSTTLLDEVKELFEGITDLLAMCIGALFFAICL